jgi:hypothetical protein
MQGSAGSYSGCFENAGSERDETRGKWQRRENFLINYRVKRNDTRHEVLKVMIMIAGCDCDSSWCTCVGTGKYRQADAILT